MSVEGEGQGNGEGQGGGGGGGAPAQAWMGALPSELQGDATLARYADIPSLARAHVEQRKTMGNMVALPGENATPEQMGALWDRLGRPADAKDYDIPLPDGANSQFADAFRPVAHQLGLTKAQAKGLTEWDVKRQTDAQAAYEAEGQRDIDALKTGDWAGKYDANVAAAKAAFKAMGFDPQFADELDRKVGSAALLKGFHKLSEQIGEHGRVDGDGEGIGGVKDADAEATLRSRQADKGWREKLNAGDAATMAERERLLAAAKRHEARG